MSSDHSPADSEVHVENHEGPIRTPKQLITAVAASFLVPILAIILLVNYVNFGNKPGAGSDGMAPDAVAKRLQKVGSVEVRDANGPMVLKTGEEVYKAQCTTCHAAGVAGAPKFGDAAAWAPRIKTGYESLLTSALKGKGAMGAQGGGDYSDTEVARAMVYMTNNGGAKFEEPKAPAQPASAAASAPN